MYGDFVNLPLCFCRLYALNMHTNALSFIWFVWMNGISFHLPMSPFQILVAHPAPSTTWDDARQRWTLRPTKTAWLFKPGHVRGFRLRKVQRFNRFHNSLLLFNKQLGSIFCGFPWVILIKPISKASHNFGPTELKWATRDILKSFHLEDTAEPTEPEATCFGAVLLGTLILSP